MKKKIVLLGIITAALAIGTATFATINNNKTAELLDANYNDNVSVHTGIYEKITDESSLRAGDKILIVGDGNKTFQYLVGASYHYWMTTEHWQFSTFYGDYIRLDKDKGELVTLEAGPDSSFYLKLEHFVDNTNAGGGGN